ncbi:DNA-directed RNA polymerase II subunit rpb1, partial [Aduncisulcus paluster]
MAERIDFGLVDPIQIKEISVCSITNFQNYDASGSPIDNSLVDPRLGASKARSCASCGGDYIECPGHFGYIELEEPVFNKLFLSKVIDILKCVCPSCGKLRAFQRAKPDEIISEIDKIANPMLRLKALVKVSGAKKCKGLSGKSGSGESGSEKTCCVLAKNFTFQNGLITMSFDADKGKEYKNRILRAKDVLEIFRIVSHADPMNLYRLGFESKHARPEWLILTVLPVPPICVRPEVLIPGNDRMQSDDLSAMLKQIISTNQELKRASGDETRQEDLYKNLYHHVTTYFNNSSTSTEVRSVRSNQTIRKSIAERLKGKEGRLRGNLMGKRVDFSARSVITGDPTISIDEVGVPVSVAKMLTIPVTVTSFNKKELQESVKNGPGLHPGATYVKSDGIERSLKIDKNFDLKEGDIVERHLRDGDFVMFNRQPSLHKMSLMGHKVRVMPYSTFRLNLSVTSPYNADFDGDEMNLHVPQSLEAIAEVKELMLVPHQIVSPQSNTPVIGIVQDVLLGCTLMTRKDVFFNREEFLNLLMWLSNWDGNIPEPSIIYPEALWTGKQLFSLIIPPEVSHTYEKNIMDVNDEAVMFYKGELVSGFLTKSQLKAKSRGTLIDLIWKDPDMGHRACRRFLNSCQRLINGWMAQHSFTVGLKDTIMSEDVVRLTQEEIETGFKKARVEYKKAASGKLEIRPGETFVQAFETNSNQILNSVMTEVGKKMYNRLTLQNNFKAMITSGSKGSTVNIGQISGLVGQQNVEGQ